MSDLILEERAIQQEEWADKFRNRAGDIDLEYRVKEQIIPLVSTLDDQMKHLVERWNENWDIWGLQERNPKYVGRSKVYDPISRDAVETIVGIIMRNLFSSITPFETKVTSANVDEDLRKRVHQLMQYFLHRSRLQRKIEMFLRHLVITGTGVLKVYWKEQQKKIWTKEKKFVKGGEGIVEQAIDIVEKIIVDGYANVDVIDPRDFIIYPSKAMNIESAVLVCEKLRVSWQDLKRGEAEGIYYDVDRIKRIELKQLREQPSLYEEQKGLVDYHPEKPFYLLYEIWTDFDIGNTGEEVPCVITLGPGNIILRIQRNPFWHQSPPYVYTQFIPDGSAYGEGIIDAVKEIQRELNERRTVQGDTFSLTLNPIILLNPRMKKILPFLRIGPGRVWPVTPNDVDTFKPPADVIQLSEAAIKRMRDEIKEYTRVTSVLAGQPTGGTATETAILQSNLQLPFAIQTENIESNVLNEVLRLYYELAKQFITDDYSFIVTGSDKPITVKYEELLDQFKFEWQGINRLGNVLFRADRIGMFLRIINEAQNIPEFKSVLQKIDFEKLLRRYWENLDMRDNPFKSSEEQNNIMPSSSAPPLVNTGMTGFPSTNPPAKPVIPKQEIEKLVKQVIPNITQEGGNE